MRDYAAEQPSGLRPVEVYAGYPPVPENAAEKSSFIYVLATDFTDEEGEDYSTAKVEIGFSIYDEDEGNGWRSLYNLMEHVRQIMLRRRCLAGRTVLVLPIKGAVPDSQPFPQWEGKSRRPTRSDSPWRKESTMTISKKTKAADRRIYIGPALSGHRLAPSPYGSADCRRR